MSIGAGNPLMNSSPTRGIGRGAGWEKLFWLLFQQTTNPIAVVDENRRFVDVNHASLEMLGRSRGELIGTSVIDVIDPNEHSESTTQWEEFLRLGEYEVRRTFVRGDGTRISRSLTARLATVGGRRLAVYVIVPQNLSLTRPPAGEASDTPLTDREREIVTLIALGRGTRDIAEELYISRETVRTHVRNAMGKLDVHTRAQLVAVVMSTESAIDLLRLE
jgi:PAS domain S-box-containing protein